MAQLEFRQRKVRFLLFHSSPWICLGSMMPPYCIVQVNHGHSWAAGHLKETAGMTVQSYDQVTAFHLTQHIHTRISISRRWLSVTDVSGSARGKNTIGMYTIRNITVA